MKWKLEYYDDLKIVELFMIGVITGPDLMASVAERIKLGREKGVTNFIINAEELIARKSATLDVLELPAMKYPEEQMARNSRLAVLVPKDPNSVWMAEFYETVCVNRGWQARIHPDRESAIRWLQS